MSYQGRVTDWMIECFGESILNDKTERGYRFLEESLELFQSIECTQKDAIALVEYVYSRPTGEVKQEVGGVMVCLAALCECLNVGMDSCSEEELKRVWSNIDKIRTKHASKKIRSPLPGITQA